MGNPLIVALSDIHCGSTVAIMPESYETNEGQVVKPNKFQKWLLENWKHDLDEFNEYRNGRDYVLILVGDMIEGVHHGGKQIWSTDEADHAGAAIQLLKPLTDGAKMVLAAKGTECHTKGHEEWIAREVGGAKCPDTGNYSWDTVAIEVGPFLVQARHHMPTTSRVYLEGSALSILLGNTQLSYARTKQRIPDILIAAHRHREGVYYDAEAMMVCCPAWQGLTRHGHKVVPGALPRPSLMAMDWTRGEDNLPHVIFFQKPLPKKMESSASWQPSPKKKARRTKT